MSSYSKPLYLVDIFNGIVSRVNTRLKAIDPLFKDVYYLYGHPVEIVKRLQEKSQVAEFKEKQFPLIALLLDVQIIVGEAIGYYGQARVNLVVCNYTQPEYTAPERLAQNFKPILYPIRDALIKEVENDTAFTRQGELKYTFIDRYYWGRIGLYGNQGNMFNDYIDAIEIQNLQLTLKHKTC